MQKNWRGGAARRSEACSKKTPDRNWRGEFLHVRENAKKVVLNEGKKRDKRVIPEIFGEGGQKPARHVERARAGGLFGVESPPNGSQYEGSTGRLKIPAVGMAKPQHHSILSERCQTSVRWERN